MQLEASQITVETIHLGKMNDVCIASLGPVFKKCLSHCYDAMPFNQTGGQMFCSTVNFLEWLKYMWNVHILESTTFESDPIKSIWVKMIK